VSGSVQNADFSVPNRRRPFGYLQFMARVASTRTDLRVDINASYTVSAQRLAARRDGHETDESEQAAINEFVTRTVNEAIVKSGFPKQGLECAP
jgi:hypothetical protein